MRLTPTEQDRLTIFVAAELARRRRAKGWRLNHPEALALICDEMHEAARGGAGYEEVLQAGASVLTEDDVLEGVPELLDGNRAWLASASDDPAYDGFPRFNLGAIRGGLTAECLDWGPI